jgi:hypothetical protein
MELFLSANESGWTANTAIELQVKEPGSNKIGQQTFLRRGNAGAALQLGVLKSGFHSISVKADNTPAQNKSLAYNLRVTYIAPQKA